MPSLPDYQEALKIKQLMAEKKRAIAKEQASRDCHFKRSVRSGNPGKHTKGDIYSIAKKQGFFCPYCGRSIRHGKWHVDHRIALSKGGSNKKDNLQVLCVTCNLRKGNRSHEEYLSIIRAERLSAS